MFQPADTGLLRRADPGLHGVRRPGQQLHKHCIAGFLGAGIALLLGGAGFGLGCAYGLIAPEVGIAAVPPPMPAARPAASAPIGLPPLTAASTATATAAPTVAATAAAQPPAMLQPVSSAWVSSHYGRRADPFTGRPALHRGIDFAAAGNSTIQAVATGVVSFSGPDGGYGNLIEIDHGHGWITRYGHNARNLVRPGDYVKPGQTIALMGATGRATGTHLHFEVLFRDRHQNPAALLPSPRPSTGA